MSPLLRLHIDQLTLTINNQTLIDQFSLTLEQGEFVGLHGPSGCGKSTLLRGIAGLLAAESGDVRLGEHSPEELGWPSFRRAVLYVQQTPTLIEGTVRENLARPFSYRALEQEFDVDAAADLLERLELKRSLLDQAAGSLSIGEQQRACLVRALQLKPPVLLLDEPISALDKDAARAVIDLLAEMRDQNQLSAIIATHQRDQVDRICDRWVELQPKGGAS
jgi:putative ABC transport system ATP-binding protein